MSNLPGNGFDSRVAADPSLKHRPVALVRLIAALLALSTLIAATAVSIGFARARIAPPQPVTEVRLAAALD